MPSALILVADGSEEIEFVTPYDVLTRAGFAVTSLGIGLRSGHATLTRRVKIIPDTGSAPSQASHDVLILPGGGPGAATFCGDETVQRLIRSYRDAGRFVGCICAATTALVASVRGAGKTDGLESARRVRVTSHPAVKAEIVDAGWDYAGDGDGVVVDGKVITSRGPGTALAFSLVIVREILGREAASEVMGPMVCGEDVRRYLE